MRRLLGKPKEKKPKATLDDATTSLDKRGGEIDMKVDNLNMELNKLKMQMKKQRKGSPAYKATHRKAMTVLKRKKMYEAQREQVYNQSFNIDQTKFACDSAKDTAVMVEAMQNTQVQLKQQYKAFDMDKIEDTMDDMEELMEMGNEINEMMGRSYGVPDEIDEDELEAELADLDDELEMGYDQEEVPDWMVSAASATNKNALPAQKDAQAAGVQLNEFGLPDVKLDNLNA